MGRCLHHGSQPPGRSSLAFWTGLVWRGLIRAYSATVDITDVVSGASLPGAQFSYLMVNCWDFANQSNATDNKFCFWGPLDSCPLIGLTSIQSFFFRPNKRRKFFKSEHLNVWSLSFWHTLQNSVKFTELVSPSRPRLIRRQWEGHLPTML